MRQLITACSLALALPALVHAASNPVVDAAKRTAAAESSVVQLTLTTSVGGQRTTMSGSGAQRGSDVRLSLRTRGPNAVRMDVIVVHEHGAYVMYMRSPAFKSKLPRGKSWIRVDLTKQAASLGVDFSSLLSASQTFAPLEKGLVSTTRIERTVVAGQSTTRYHAVIDVRRAARAVPAYRKQLAAVERATGITLRRLPYDVWIATDGRIRRVRFAMPVASAGLRGSVSETITYLAFDRPVTIEAPPRSQVVSA